MATYEEFAEALAADEELRAKCAEFSKEYDPKDEDEELEAKRAVAAKLGFDVPASEFRLATLATQELDDAELDMVAGGWKRSHAGIDLQKTDSPTGTPVAKLHW